MAEIELLLLFESCSDTGIGGGICGTSVKHSSCVVNASTGEGVAAETSGRELRIWSISGVVTNAAIGFVTDFFIELSDDSFWYEFVKMLDVAVISLYVFCGTGEGMSGISETNSLSSVERGFDTLLSSSSATGRGMFGTASVCFDSSVVFIVVGNCVDLIVLIVRIGTGRGIEGEMVECRAILELIGVITKFLSFVEIGESGIGMGMSGIVGSSLNKSDLEESMSGAFSRSETMDGIIGGATSL